MPEQKDFDTTVADVQQMVHQFDPDMSTTTGSAIRQLLVRPVAYIYTKLKELFRTFIADTSLSTLHSRPQAVTDVVDDIASNFFITRKDGTKATGTLAVFMDRPSTYLPAGLSVQIDGVEFHTQSRIYISLHGADVADTVVQVMSYPYTDTLWVAMIPVQADYFGVLQIPSQTPVQYSWNIAGIQNIQLLSPITGGADVQTDQQLISRMRDEVSYQVQTTQTSIQKRLNKAPVPVLSCCAQSADTAAERSLYNTAQLQLGGAIDIFIKTANQPSETLIAAQCVSQTATNSDSTRLVLHIESTAVAGLLRVLDIHEQVSGTPVNTYSVQYGSCVPASIPPAAARYSHLQTVSITSSEFNEGVVYTVHIMYMPGVYSVQKFIEQQQNRYLGQSLLVRAGIPVSVGCSVAYRAQSQLTPAVKMQIANSICGYICSIKIGTPCINFSDLKLALQAAFPNVSFRLPCVFTATIPVNGQQLYTFSTQSGVLDLINRVPENSWGTSAYFFYALIENIELVQV